MTFTMLVGIPGSGKSTMAEILKKDTDAVIVSSDNIRLELFGDPGCQKDNGKVFNLLHKRVHALLKAGVDVIYDATNLSCRRRMNFLKELERYDVTKKCVVMLTSFDDCVKRQLERVPHRVVPEGVIKNMIRQFQCPYYYEGWDEIELCRTSHVPITWFVNQNKIPHDNSNHELDIDKHMELADSLYMRMADNYDESVRQAVMFHDIGKYFTKQFTLGNGLPDSEAHYYGHQNAGAYFYLLDGMLCGHNGLEDSLYTACLIQWHMEFYLREEKGMTKLENVLGYRMMRDLEFINKIDKLAH